MRERDDRAFSEDGRFEEDGLEGIISDEDALNETSFQQHLFAVHIKEDDSPPTTSFAEDGMHGEKNLPQKGGSPPTMPEVHEVHAKRPREDCNTAAFANSNQKQNKKLAIAGEGVSHVKSDFSDQND